MGTESCRSYSGRGPCCTPRARHRACWPRGRRGTCCAAWRCGPRCGRHRHRAGTPVCWPRSPEGEIGVRVASGGGPRGTAEFSVEAHLLPFVLELHRFCAGRWHVADKSTLPSRLFVEFSLRPQTLKRTVFAVLPSFTRPFLIAIIPSLMHVTNGATACECANPPLRLFRWKTF